MNSYNTTIMLRNDEYVDTSKMCVHDKEGKEVGSSYKTLVSLPTDVISQCISPFLCKAEQYQWLSPCKAWKSLLVECRTLFINDTDERRMTTACTLKKFLANKQHFLQVLGCTTSRIRKIKLHILIVELVKHEEEVLSIACYLSALHVFENPKFYYREKPANILPFVFEKPTTRSLQRWLQSASIRCGGVKLDFELCGLIMEFTKTFSEPNEVFGTLNTGNMLTHIRGVSRLVVQYDTECYVELGSTVDITLQYLSYHRCSTITDVPYAPSVSVSYCPNVTRFDSFSHVEKVELTGMLLDDISMLGKVKKLVLQHCEAFHFPVPEYGIEQEWVFHDVNLVDVTPFANLEKLTLTELIYAKDLTPLGKIKTLVIRKCKGNQFPIPLVGMGQDWTFGDVNISNMSSFAGLERLKLVRCHDVLDISMLGTIRFLTIEACNHICQYKQLPIPKGRLQEWRFTKMDMWNIESSMKLSFLHRLELEECNVDSSVWGLKNIKHLHIDDCKNDLLRINLFQKDGKLCFIDKDTLKTAVDLWCINEESAKVNYGHISTWDVSKVNNMNNLFQFRRQFNSNINSWDVSNVLDMSGMFHGATSFDQPLDAWDVGNVMNMERLFEYATEFNQSIDSWDVSNVVDMTCMFRRTIAFNQPLDSWIVDNVISMIGMFSEATKFNQPLESWHMSNVVELNAMFYLASSFNQPLEKWNIRRDYH